MISAALARLELAPCRTAVVIALIAVTRPAAGRYGRVALLAQVLNTIAAEV